MKPCISQVTTLPSSFADDVAHWSDAGCPGMEVWLTKLETHLESHSVADTGKLLADRGIALAAAAYQGGLLLAQGEPRKVHYDHFRRRLDLCQQLNIPTLLLAADFAQAVEPGQIERAAASLHQAAQWAAAFNVRLALEFRGRDTFCASLDTALALVEQCGEANLGINLDVFHYYTGPSKFEDLAHLSPGRLLHVQLSDLAGVPRELARDSDRIIPGDGDFQLEPLLNHLRQAGYDGWISVELMNPILWKAKAIQVVEIAYTALRKLLAAG
jgi:2-keto-myo-inositol isomerase